MNYNAIPQAMKDHNSWVVWDYRAPVPSPLIPKDIPMKRKKRPVGSFAFLKEHANSTKQELMADEESSEHLRLLREGKSAMPPFLWNLNRVPEYLLESNLTSPEYHKVLKDVATAYMENIKTDPEAGEVLSEAVRAMTHLMTYEEAVARQKKYGFEGIGFALGRGWSGLDFDDCLDSETGKSHSKSLEEILKHLADKKCWVERSPSGKGIKVFCRETFTQEEINTISRLEFSSKASMNVLTRRFQSTGTLRFLRDMKAFEYFLGAGWFTVTGDKWGDDPSWSGKEFEDMRIPMIKCINKASYISQRNQLPVGMRLLGR